MDAPRVTILLSTFNGERFLQPQLDSILTQSYPNWRLLWRDDGSTDETRLMMRAFQHGAGAGRCIEVGALPHLDIAASFMHLLREAGTDGLLAFADQDDVWLPDKLARGVAALGTVPDAVPALYCARQHLVDASLQRLGTSPRMETAPDFPAGLTQNLATGCTVMLNAAAARLLAASEVPPGTLHDWWSYLLISGGGGRVLIDPSPTVLYRQHDGNAVGAPRSWPRRGWAALRRGPDGFMTTFRVHITALRHQTHLLTPEAAAMVDAVAIALEGGTLRRLKVLRRLPGLHRYTRLETLLFRLWFVLG